MNPQDQTPRSNAEDAPPKVTPETPRSVIQVDLPTDDLDANCGDLPFLSLSTSFFAGIKRLEPRPGLSHDEDATRRTADLLRVLPVRKMLSNDASECSQQAQHRTPAPPCHVP